MAIYWPGVQPLLRSVCFLYFYAFLLSSLLADYGYWTVSDSLELFPRSGATLATPYLANPDSRLDENPRSTYTVPGGCIHAMFNDSFNAIYIGNATLAQLPNLSIVTNFPCNSLPPSLSSASTPRPSPTDLFPPTYLTAKHGMGIKPVGSHPMRMASNRRREKLPEFPCPFPECSADFTARHNLECLYFFTHYMFSPSWDGNIQIIWTHT